MPIGIGVEGGVDRKEAFQNVRKVGSEQALETLQQIKTHLSQPGRDSGVLTLHNRTNSGTEMTLERKNSFQMMFQDKKRLDDTVVTMRSLLFSAGRHDAVQELDRYLLFGKGDRNKIESSKMLEILNQYLPQGGQQGAKEPVETGKAPEVLHQGGDQKLVEQGKVSEIVDPPVPPPDDEGGGQDRLDPKKMLETVRPILPPPGATKEEVYLSSGLEKLKELSTGGFGTTSLIKYGGEQLILKEMNSVKPVHRDRSLIDRNNEATAAFLSTGKHSVILDTVNITQPISFLISTKNEGKDEFRLVNAHTLRALLKFESEQKRPSEVLCHGLVMPEAQGKRATELFETGLGEKQQKNFCRSTLESIKGLNEHGFVHRDIKPDNTFIDPDTGTATLIDTGTLFKESKHVGYEDRPQYIEGWGMGSYMHMHPRARDGKAHGTETDLYAFAVMTTEMAYPNVWKNLSVMLNRHDVPKEGQTYDREWLRGTLDRKIETAKSEEAKATSDVQKAEWEQKRKGFEALRRDMDDPSTAGGFAVECFEKTCVSSEIWHDRTKAQAMYEELLQHPFLKQKSV